MTFYQRCALCGAEFSFGPRRYEGHYIDAYKILVCNTCWDGNWDGWSPYHEIPLLAHLVSHDIPIPARNERGWLPRDPGWTDDDAAGWRNGGRRANDEG